MAQLDRLLDDMRLRVKKADFAGLAALAPALESALAEGAMGLDAGSLQKLKVKAEENAAFLDAARRGLRAARRRLEEVRHASHGLQTYDGKGRRAEISPVGPTAGRF